MRVVNKAKAAGFGAAILSSSSPTCISLFLDRCHQASLPFSTCSTASSQSRVAIAIVNSSPKSSIQRRSFESASEPPIVDKGRFGWSKLAALS